MRLSPTLLLAAVLAGLACTASGAPLVVYTAKKIITMEPALPEATAVAVADGRIVAVGSLDSLKPWLAVSEVTIDHSLDDKVVMPGFIDPHVHPSLPAVLTQFPFLAPDDWSLPTGEFPGASTPARQRAEIPSPSPESVPMSEPTTPARPAFWRWAAGRHSLPTSTAPSTFTTTRACPTTPT